MSKPMIYVVIDMLYGDEGNPGIRLYRKEADAIAEEKRLLAEDPQDGTYIVIRDTATLE